MDDPGGSFADQTVQAQLAPVQRSDAAVGQRRQTAQRVAGVGQPGQARQRRQPGRQALETVGGDPQQFQAFASGHALGKASRRLPASISFCNGRRPSSSGSVAIRLSVRISQRSAGGRAAAGTRSMRLDLKPTMLSAGQSPTAAGNSSKSLAEQNSTLRRCSRPRSSGRLSRALPLRLSTSRESASSKISRGTRAGRRTGPGAWRRPVRRCAVAARCAWFDGLRPGRMESRA